MRRREERGEGIARDRRKERRGRRNLPLLLRMCVCGRARGRGDVTREIVERGGEKEEKREREGEKVSREREEDREREREIKRERRVSLLSL